MQRDPDKYLPDTCRESINALLDGTPGVVFCDYTTAVGYAHKYAAARQEEVCDWGMLDDTFLPLGFGIAFYQGSPYKPHIDEV